MQITSMIHAFLLVLLMTALPATAENLAKHDRVVFLGDSITQGGAAPDGYITLVRQSLEKEHKDLEVEVIGAGISGNKVPDLEGRLDRDVLAKKPTVVVTYIGINDVWHSQNGRGTSKDAFEKGLRSLVKRNAEAGARTILCTASVIGEKTDGSNPLDKMLDEYCEITRDVAKDTKTQLIDLRKAFLAYLKEHNPDNKERGVLTGDGVHLNAAGNKFVAEQMLTGLVGGSEPKNDAGANKSEAKGKMLRHVVLFKFKEGTTKDQLKAITDAFAQLPNDVDTIKGFEWGTDNSPEMLSQGFTHCFLVTFANAAGRDAYLPHAAHKKFVELALPSIEKALVVDFWVQE